MIGESMLRVALVVLTLNLTPAFAFLPKPVTPLHAHARSPILPNHRTSLNVIVEEKANLLRCMGSLITERVILSAADCVSSESKSYKAIFYNKPWYDVDNIQQVRRIVDIAFHPNYESESRLYNIALMKLIKKVKLNVNIIPACLWPHEDIREPTVHVPFVDHDSRIKREPLSPIDTSGCASDLSFASKYSEYQFASEERCAEYETIQQCSEWKIGPIEMRMSHDGRTVPMIIGILCDVRNKVNAYIPIFKFRDWITATLESFRQSHAAEYVFEPSDCAERHKHLREHTNNYIFDDDVLLEDDFDPNKNKMPFNSHTVKLLWADELATNVSSCYGAHVEPDAIVTLARCTSYLGTPPSKVLFYDLSELTIREIIVHPNYTRSATPNYNDVAVVKLESPVKFIPTICGWYDKMEPSWFLQRGAKAIVTESFDSVGLNLVANEVELDTPMIGIWFNTHKAWLESVLLKDNAEKTPSFNEVPHIDSGRKHGDKCAYSDGSRGTCADITNCRTIKKRLDASKPITFCTNRTVVCCPQQLISPIERDLEACAQHYSHLRQERHAKSMDDDSLDKQSPHLVEIGWAYPPYQFIECIGYLITARDIITMASCVGRRDSPANVVRFGGIWPRNANDPTLIRIGKIEYHPMYNKTTKDHNFAIVTLVSAYEPNWSIFPGCIWLNETHFPAHQKLWVEHTKGFYDIYQMYHGDCEAYLKRSVTDSEACMFRKRWTCASYYNPILKEASPKC
uniref:Peptidase S1 domain-containing protein n=1 Tax=Anopheles quadriannulatus TaxID=34691 RepID=A0A182X7W2_ANOQN